MQKCFEILHVFRSSASEPLAHYSVNGHMSVLFLCPGSR